MKQAVYVTTMLRKPITGVGTCKKKPHKFEGNNFEGPSNNQTASDENICF